MSNINSIDFKKYKRFFAFGCSVTNYSWPTWADIIGKNIPEYYNFGRAGAGNLFISNRIAEMNQRFSFSENDLIIVMWTSFDREDKYISGDWKCYGNVYKNNLYDIQYIKKYVDPRGFLVRDMGLISLTYHFLNSLSSDFCMLSSLPLKSNTYSYDEPLSDELNLNDAFQLYDSILQKIKPDLSTIVFNNNWKTIKIRLTDSAEKRARSWREKKDWGNLNWYDNHPLPIHHLIYLKSVFQNFDIDQDVKDFVSDCTKEVLNKNGYELNDPNSYWKGNCLNYVTL